MDTSADVSRLSNMAGSSQRSVAYRHSIICVLLTWCHMSLMYRDSSVSQTMYLPRFPVKGSALISYLQTFITFILPACNLFLPLRSWLAISPVGYFKSDTNRLLRRWEEFLSTSSLPVIGSSFVLFLFFFSLTMLEVGVISAPLPGCCYLRVLIFRALCI